jgi:hypothetical protein
MLWHAVQLSDPLTQLEYTMRAGEDGNTVKISIKNRFWINNSSLNQKMTLTS